ncbi:MarR family winged helix-turn-helix transcriptional regulator [Companilactobacillus baiquanensis]|uniref:MarR family winged helix-turn-helix transcriptional regulator n=1 Tax=Companilactobacillus baiquanensis TaxID=2486005 RepID=A0ABW1USP5_9LACO|nr:MarR family transcriptional regulator [Companilactobacillus baiquanensis]
MDDYNLIGFAVRFIMQKKRIIRAYLKDTDLNMVDSIVMMIVNRHPDCNQETIGEITLFDGAIIARSLKKLEQMDFVVREVDPANRRKKIVQITTSGAEFVKRLRADFKDANEELYSNLTDEELNQLEHILTKVYANIDGIQLSK